MSHCQIRSITDLESWLGKEAGQSEWFSISQERIDQFAQITCDTQWIHINPERAARELPGGVPIAHGFLTLSLLSYLHASCIQVELPRGVAINYGVNRVRFPTPVPVNSRIRTRSTLLSLTPLDDGWVQAVWQVTYDLEGSSKPACVAEWIVRYA